MPTIAEVIAAKKASANPTKNLSKPYIAQPDPSEESINRIDPPGKSGGATAARRSAGIILRKELSELSSEAPCGERRSLSQRQGEAIPMTPLNADLEATTWHQAMNSYETDLVVMRDPIEPEVAWLAVRPERSDLPPILLHRLPWAIWNYPTAPTETEPF
jgi:hypothetical protein